MEPELSEVDEITQALDYLADQNYTDEQRQKMIECLTPIDTNIDLDMMKADFAGNIGAISRLRTLVRFIEKYQSNTQLIEELQIELEYLAANIQGGKSGGLSI